MDISKIMEKEDKEGKNEEKVDNLDFVNISKIEDNVQEQGKEEVENEVVEEEKQEVDDEEEDSDLEEIVIDII